MSIITISRSFCSKGHVVAEKVAEAMGYECLSREILLEASELFNVPEVILAKAIHDGPSGYDRFSRSKENYIAFIQSALFSRLKRGNVVYHGLAGHFFVQDVPHVLKVRLLADMDARIVEEMDRENLSEDVARKRLVKDDKERCNWSSYLYKIDTRDSELYDLVINLRHVSIDDSVTMICNTLDLPYFKETQDAKDQLEDLALAATVKAAIVNRFYNAVVKANSGNIIIDFPDPLSHVEQSKDEIKGLIADVDGVKEVYMNMKSNVLTRTAMHK